MIKDDSRLTQPKGNKVLWRYMNFVSFYSFVMNKELYFNRLDQYSDNFEGTLHESTLKELYEYRRNFDYTTHKEAEDWVKTEIANIESYKAHTLANSWMLAEDENYLMWKIYLRGHNEGIAIKTTVDQLRDCLNKNTDVDIYTGQVSYLPVKRKDLNVFTVSTNKRSYYQSESEYRALILRQFHFDKERKNRIPNYDKGANVSVELSKLINEIYVSPFAGKWFDELVISVTKTHLPFLNSDRIKKSNIRDK